MEFHEPPFYLEELKLEVTYNCPLVCVHCSSDAAPNVSTKIEREKCISIIDEANEMGVKEIAFSGGEPLNYYSIVDVIAHTVNLNIIPILYTSGYAINIKNIFNRLKDVGLRNIIFSIFGNSESSHQKITRVGDSYYTTIKSIKTAVSLGFNTEIHFVAFKSNYNELKGIANKVRSYGVNKISVLRFVPQGRGVLFNEEMLKDEYLELKREIENLRENHFNIRTGSPFNFLLLNNQPQCTAGINKLFVDPYLNIYPCDAFKQISSTEIVNTDKFSNLYFNSLKECWEKSPYLNAIRKYLTTDFAEPCSSCMYLEQCLSGCLAQKVIKYNNLNKHPDPSCILGMSYIN